jgi:Fe-S cluster assembly scaffold protein SufB
VSTGIWRQRPFGSFDLGHALDLADGAEVTWIILQGRGEKDQHLGQLNARLGADAKLKLFVINAGGKLVRQESCRRAGEGAHLTCAASTCWRATAIAT